MFDPLCIALPVVIINSTTALTTSILVQWNPIQEKILPYTFREYYVYIVKGSSKHYFTTSDVSYNITNLQPSTEYNISVSYSVTDHDGKVIDSAPSDNITVTTLPMRELHTLTCSIYKSNKWSRD